MKKESALKHPLLGRVNALAVLAAWVCLASSVVAFAYLKLSAPPDASIFPLVLTLAAFMVLVVAHITLSSFVRCPHCDGRLTSQGFAKPPFGDWSGVIVRWFTGSIVCIHCGERVRTGGRGHDL